MKATYDQNGNRVTKSIRREPDGTWSRVVWSGSGCVTNVARRYGYSCRAAVEAGDISESVAETNARHERKKSRARARVF